MKEQKEKTIKTYIWGAADGGRRALDYCNAKFNIAGFIDKRADSNFIEFCSMPVMAPALFFEKAGIEWNINIIIAVRYPAEVIDLMRHYTDFRNIDLYIFDGRDRNDPLLYKVKDGEICVPEYMNKRFGEWKEYADHYSRLNPFILEMFQTALAWIREYKKTVQICELGCGSGQFANMLFDHGYREYTGIDFSSRAIEMARNANPSHTDKFICDNVFSYLERKENTNHMVFAAFEILEHIGRDVELCNIIPKGSTFIFSVPNFKSFNHMRTFQDLKSIQNRYTMLDIVKYLALPANDGADKIYHLVETIRR